jgi:hypothetical protein
MFLIGAWNYRFRSRAPPFMDAKLSQGEHIGDLDELEEEFNVVPASRAQEVSNSTLLPDNFKGVISFISLARRQILLANELQFF